MSSASYSSVIMRMFMLLSISMNIYVSCLEKPIYCPAKNMSCQTIYLPTCPADNIYLAYIPRKNTLNTPVVLSPILFLIMAICLLASFYVDKLIDGLNI